MMRLLAVAALAAHASIASAGHVLPAGGKLSAGEKLTSPDGRQTFVMQADGNLVQYHGATAVWSSGTSGIGAAEWHMQADGNSVVYAVADGVKTAKWATMTGMAGSHLGLQDDGNAVIYHDRVAQWSSGSAGQVAALNRLHLGLVEFGHDPLDIIGVAKDLATVVRELKPENAAKPRPKPGVPASLANVPDGKKAEVAKWSARVLRYGKWAVRSGGRVVPVVGWAINVAIAAHDAYEGAILLCEGGEWIYYQLAGEDEESNPHTGRIKLLAEGAGGQEAISPSREADGTCTLIFETGYLSATAEKVVANGIRVGEAEKFRITRHDDGTVSLQSVATGKYLATTKDEGQLTANAEASDPAAKFTPEVYAQKLFLKRPDGKYVSAEPHRRLTHRVKENVVGAAVWTKDKAVDGGEWVGEKASDGATWTWRKVKAGWSFVRRQWD